MSITVTLTETRMKDGSTKLQLKTPYSPSLPTACKALGGKWGAGDKAWYFDTRDANRVRDLCLQTFGIDPLAEPDEQPELVTVRVALDWPLSCKREVWMFGRELAGRSGRDYSVRLGEGVVVQSGGFPASGGSVKNPHINAKEGTILEVRDVPRALVTESDGVVIIDDAPAAEVVPTGNQQIRALFTALDSSARRQVIMAMVSTLTPAERVAVLKEIELLKGQGNL